MPAIKITIGARLDPASANVFAPLIAQAERARATIGSIGKKATEEFVGGYRTAPARTKAGFDGVTKQAEQSAKAIAAAAKRTDAERASSMEHVFQIKMRYLAAEEAAEKASAEKRQKTVAGILSRGGSGAVGMVRGAIGVAGQIARGVGVNADVGSLMGKVSGQQTSATEIANSGYLEGDKGSAGVRQNPAAILSEARAAADKARISTDTALEGLQAFVGKTTDLDTGRALLSDMAVLSKSTGANMADVMNAAGSVSVKMGDIPNKAAAVSSLMSIIAKQGKVGAVEMKTMAAQISGFIGPANQFKEGIAGAVVELGAAFQLTNKFGGVKGPAQAATSVASFANDFTSKSGLKALNKAGITDDQIFADKGKTKLKSLAEIIPALLDKAGGDLTKIAAEMPNKRSGSVLKAFQQVYNAAEATQKGSGHAATVAAFAQYGGGTSNPDTVAALGTANETTASKVQLLNNQLEKIAESASAKILPALEKLSPDLISFAGSIGDMAGYIAQNPLKSAAIALSASIAKEAAAIGLKTIIEKSLMSSVGQSLGMTFAVAMATIAITDAVFNLQDKAKDNTRDVGVAASNTESELRMAAKSGAVQKGSLDDDAKLQLELQQRIDAAKAVKPSYAGPVVDAASGALSGAANFITGGAVGTGFGAQARQSADVEGLAGLQARLDGLKTESAKVHQALSAGTLKVMVMNPDAIGNGGAKPGTTGPTPPVGH